MNNKHRYWMPFLIFCISGSILFSSCSKNRNYADAFEGVYSVSVIQNVVWGNTYGTLTDTGTLTITEVSSTRIMTSGYFHTYGEIVGSTVYFEPMTSSDSAGYIETVFGPAVLSGNVLTFTATQTGQLANNGILYPFRSSDQITAIKQY